MWLEVNKSSGLKVCVSPTVLYMGLCMYALYGFVCLRAFLLCVRGSWCVCLMWVYVSGCDPHVAIGQRCRWRNLIGALLSGTGIMQLTLSKAAAQPCFLQAASH